MLRLATTRVRALPRMRRGVCAGVPIDTPGSVTVTSPTVLLQSVADNTAAMRRMLGAAFGVFAAANVIGTATTCMYLDGLHRQTARALEYAEEQSDYARRMEARISAAEKR